ncbi:ABC transporter ATP-binding protein [Roseovarius spongiae]|uniref:ABC transporter ATP-binding protein n=1 Tax=Roseovarius spongiae TaxID=2320272 RepID=A0A3A8B5S6_9RHOB|nr:ABC transporter ATP-binding protein [Roseovarius spongiae]RKF15306.1 ABC transporter ATP-binding protein [Roseovarius spongiae]
MNQLEIRKLTMKFGGVTAIDGIDLSVAEGEIRGLIGPNGAGKTTLFNACSGRYPITSGEIIFGGERVHGLKPHEICRKGLVRTFQHVTLFKGFSVLKNVMVGNHLHANHSYWGSLLRTPRTRRSEAESARRAREILEFVGLGNILDREAAGLPHGHQKALGIAIALAAQPKLLLLDEPCAGMNNDESREMIDLVRRIRDTGITVMLIEHDMKVVMGLCDRITVLSFGTCIAEGTPAEVRENPEVREAYLGSQANVA